MELPEPFSYPTKPHTRRHGPAGYADYTQFKPWLRDEFTFRCVYCLERERWYPDRGASFSADHFVARALDPAKALDYDNLVYACTRCNSFKQHRTASLDPTAVALADHLRVDGDGKIAGLTREGRRLIRLLHLDDVPAVEVREECLLVLRAKREQPDNPTIHELFLRKFGFPTDLPNLASLRPPGANSREKSEQESYYARNERLELPSYY